MVVQVDMDRVVSLLTQTEKKTIYLILRELDLTNENAQSTLNISAFRQENGVHRALMASSFKVLTLLDLISVASLGSNGTLIYVRNAEACEEMKKILASCV